MDSNPIVGYEKVKVIETPLSAFDTDFDFDDNGDSSNRSAGLSLGDNGFASDNNYGNRDKELMLAALTARQRQVTQLLTEGYSHDWTCLYPGCGIRNPWGKVPGLARIEVDHCTSLFHFGAYYESNLQTLCAPHNKAKGIRDADYRR